jgi:hypothetical protein
MFVIVVLFLPKGIVGLPGQLLSLCKRSSAALKKILAPRGTVAELPLKPSSTRHEKEIHPHR